MLCIPEPQDAMPRIKIQAAAKPKRAIADRLMKYVNRGKSRVQGWLNPIAMRVLVELANSQKDLGITGPVCEIGVHHGKLFILLHLLTDEPEIGVAWDLFERQGENVDGSGHGDRAIFQKNLKRHDCDVNRIKIRTENSRNLTAAVIIEECEGRVRLFSIDGGHTREITFNDLSLADAVLCDGGIVILDDFFNEAWPGVAEGVCKYFADNETDLIPVAIVGNKVFMTNNRTAAEKFRACINRPHHGYALKKSHFLGNEVLIMTARERTLRSYLGRTATVKWIRNKLLKVTAVRASSG